MTVVALLIVALLPSAPASAYVNDTLTACPVNNDIRWHFDSGFPSAKKDAVRDAFDTIEGALDYDGTPLVDITETSISPSLTVYINDDAPLGSYGFAVCGISMWISGTVSGSKFLWRTARHEMMHLWPTTSRWQT
ncbi:MAG: hypothetical protein QM602_04380 [Microbacterium sp.]